MTDFRFVPAPDAPPEAWRLDGNHLHGPRGVLDLGALDSVVWTQTGWLRRLDLKAGATTLRLASAEGVTAADAAMHLEFCKAVAARIAAIHPTLPVTIGLRRRVRLAKFLAGAGLLCIALGLTAWIVRTGATGDALALAAGGVLAAGAAGLSLMQGNRPWGTGLSVPAALFPAVLDAVEGSR